MARWDVQQSRSPAAIVVRIHGEIENGDAADAARRVDALLERTSGPLEVCIDIRAITGYTVTARESWSSLLRRHRDNIELLTWVTVRSTHRMVGRAVGLFTGIRTRLLDELPASYSQAS
jgi:hypothetical protein